MENDKVKAHIIGANGNIFNILGISMGAMRVAGIKQEVIDQMYNEVTSSDCYGSALAKILEYVEPVDISYKEEMNMDF